MESAREARRRKILERGSDRIRMITTGSVDPQSGSDKPQGEENRSGNEIDNSGLIDADPVKEGIANVSSIDSNKDHEAKKETLVDHQLTRNLGEILKSNDEITPQIAEENKIEQEIKREEAKIAPNLTENRSFNNNNKSNNWIFTPNEIGQAVSNSEIIRLIFTVFFSFLVIKGFISSKPLLILILTDITIIIGILIANQDDKKKREKVKKYEMPVDKIGMSLEIGILATKVLGVIFMDSCIYAVIMICGLGI